MRKIPFAGIELTSQRVRVLRCTSELPGRPSVGTFSVELTHLVVKWSAVRNQSEIETSLKMRGMSPFFFVKLVQQRRTQNHAKPAHRVRRSRGQPFTGTTRSAGVGGFRLALAIGRVGKKMLLRRIPIYFLSTIFDDLKPTKLASTFHRIILLSTFLYFQNQSAPRPSEHPPVMGGGNVKTFRWDQRLQIQNIFMTFKQVPRCR